MSSTNPSDLAALGWDGNSDTTEATNAISDTRGYPVVVDGQGVVNIVAKERDGQGTELLVDAAGNKYVQTVRHNIITKAAWDAENAAIEAELLGQAEEPATEPETDETQEVS